MKRDMSADYAYYRLQLQAVLFQRPGQPLILKEPCHTWHLPVLLEVLPDARVIHLRRDIGEVASSFASSCCALTARIRETPGPRLAGELSREDIEAEMARVGANTDRVAEALLDAGRPMDRRVRE